MEPLFAMALVAALVLLVPAIVLQSFPVQPLRALSVCASLHVLAFLGFVLVTVWPLFHP